MAEDIGAPNTEAALLISYLAVGSAIGRLIFGKIADYKQLDRFYIWQIGLLGMSVSSTLVTLAYSYKWLVVYAFTFGFFEGCYVPLNPVLICDILGADKFAYGLGMSFFVMSFTRSAGPPIAGWIYDVLHSYYSSFLCTGLTFFVASSIVFLVPLLIRKNYKPDTFNELKIKETAV